VSSSYHLSLSVSLSLCLSLCLCLSLSLSRSLSLSLSLPHAPSINFANEKLQDHFNYSIFKSEQEVYEEEGLQWTLTNYPDNSERLELFEHKRVGLFLLCDEQLKIPKPSDEKLVKSFYLKHLVSSSSFFSATRAEQMNQEFVIHHYACSVKYSSQSFVEKNRNEIGQEIYESGESSTEEFVRNLFSIEGGGGGGGGGDKKRGEMRNSLDEVGPSGGGGMSRERANSRGHKLPSKTTGANVGVGGGGGGGGTKKPVSVISQFSLQLHDLIQKIRSMRSHFIRCIKPNNSLQPQTFDTVMIQSQLRCGGALGAIQVFQIGFPNRMEFKYFVTRYSCFLSVCGNNVLTADVLSCIQYAKATSTDELWKTATSMLLDIIALTVTILSLTTGGDGNLFDGLTDSGPSSSNNNNNNSSSGTSGMAVVKGLQMGKTQVFLKAYVFEFLERLQMHAQIFIAKILQRRRRALLIKRQYQASLQQDIFSSSPASPSSSVLLRYHAMESYLYIVSKRRSQVRNSISASILLQRKMRVFLMISWRKRILRAITRLKAYYRGSVARRCVHEMKVTAACRIQTLYRCYHWTQRYLAMRASAKILQKYLRRFLAIQSKRLKLRVVLQLQCLWRGTMARIRTVAYRMKLVSLLDSLLTP
jgi:hypothetical protein